MSDQLNGVNGANAQPTLSLTFTVQEWMTLRAGLYELPGKIGIPVIGKLEQMLMQGQQAQLVTDEVKQQGSVIQ